MGVKFVGVGTSDSVVVIALNPEMAEEAAELDELLSSGSASEDEAPTGDGVQPESAEVGEDDSE